MRLNPGDSIIMYIDGFRQALDASGQLYGIDRLVNCFSVNHSPAPQKMIDACLEDQRSFRSSRTTTDDLTIMVIQRVDSTPDDEN